MPVSGSVFCFQGKLGFSGAPLEVVLAGTGLVDQKSTQPLLGFVSKKAEP